MPQHDDEQKSQERQMRELDRLTEDDIREMPQLDLMPIRGDRSRANVNIPADFDFDEQVTVERKVTDRDRERLLDRDGERKQGTEEDQLGAGDDTQRESLRVLEDIRDQVDTISNLLAQTFNEG